jgi:UDP-glucose 4-epimerase
MNILLTGGAGYIGSHVALNLLDQEHEVTIIDSLVNSDGKLIPPEAKFIKSDIADEKIISKIFVNKKYDVVMHFAGFTRVGESVKFTEKYILNNYEKAKTFFNICIENNIKKAIFSSTGSIYGNLKQNINISESVKPNPTNPYSESKFKLENFLIKKSDEKLLDTIILRYFNVAGSDEKMRSGLLSNPDNLIKAVCEVATYKKKKFTVNGNKYNTKDGTAIRDLIHVSDLAEMHLLAAKKIIKKNGFEIYNCGYGMGYSIEDVIKEMNNLIGRKINYEYGPNREGDVEYSVSDNTKFKKNFKWEPKHNNLNYILKTALNWEKSISNK